MELRAKAAGLKFVGEPSGKRDIGPTEVVDQVSGLKRPQYDWEIGLYWGEQLGFYAFESAGTYYFAGVDYLRRVAKTVQINHRTSWDDLARYGPKHEATEVPTCRASQSRSVPENLAKQKTDVYFCDVSIRAKVVRPQAEALRPAMFAAFSGVPPFFEGIRQLITKVSWDLSDLHRPADVEAGTLAGKHGNGRTAADDVASQAGSNAVLYGSKNKQALDFVTMCLRQVGDRYVYGAETDLANPDPHAFDCSELVQWACAQVGVSFPDGTWAQEAAATKITVAQAAKIRGALLFRPGHVAVSLGDGRNTVEAKGAAYGVVSGGTQGIIAGRFTSGGLIPGMKYEGSAERYGTGISRDNQLL
jgi:cell wall-associated NlpC family hydrolase